MLTLRDRFRIIKHLYLSTDKAKLVQARMDAVNAESEFLASEVLTTLDELDSTRKILSRERTTANNALTKADVLEWQPGQRTQGMLLERGELQQQLNKLLGPDKLGNFLVPDWSRSRVTHTSSLEIQVF